jgi:DNA primase catalytic subunit
MTMHRSIRGRIRYTSKKPERMDHERGREWFAFTYHGDGSVVIRVKSLATATPFSRPIATL